MAEGKRCCATSKHILLGLDKIPLKIKSCDQTQFFHACDNRFIWTIIRQITKKDELKLSRSLSLLGIGKTQGRSSVRWRTAFKRQVIVVPIE